MRRGYRSDGISCLSVYTKSLKALLNIQQENHLVNETTKKSTGLLSLPRKEVRERVGGYLGQVHGMRLWKVFKIIGKAIITSLFVSLSLVLATGYYAYYYQGKILASAFHMITTTLGFPVEAKHIKVSLLKDFPNISLSFGQVTIQGAPHAAPLLVAEAVIGTLDMTRLLRKDYVIEQLWIQQGAINLSTGTQAAGKGEDVATTTASASELAFPIHLKKVVLENVQWVISHPTSGQSNQIQVKSMVAKIRPQKHCQQICLDGQVVVAQWATEVAVYPLEIPIQVHANIDYHVDTKGSRYSGTLNIHKVPIYVQGSWVSTASLPYMDVQVQAPNITLVQVLAWLPTNLREQLVGYQPQGILTCNVQCKYQDSLGIQADFTLKEASLWIKKLNKMARIANLSGKLNIPNIQKLHTGTLQVARYEAAIGHSQVSGSLQCNNLASIHIKNQAKVTLDIPLLTEIWPMSSISHPKGKLVGNLDLAMQVGNLSSLHQLNKSMQLQGKFHMQGVQCRYNKVLLELQENGCFLVQDGKLHFKELSGYLDGKPFEIAGTMCYGGTSLKKPDEKLQGKMKIYADYIALDKILPVYEVAGHDDNDRNKMDWTRLSDYFQGEIECDIDEITYQNFQGNKVRGKLQVKAQQMVLEAGELVFAGGQAKLSSCIDTKPNGLKIVTQAKLQNVQLPMLFHAFNNFDQQFLKDKHLGGQICSDVHFTVHADKHFSFDTHTLQANLAIQLHHGVLRDFEPMCKLSAYVAEKDELSLLKFSSIKNNIKIANQTIYIPPMEIHTSLTSIQLSGTHTLDGKIAYQLIVPIQPTNVPKLRDQMPEINEDALAGLNLHLKLEGTTEDYTLRYDSALLKLNLKESLSKQRDMLGKVLKGDKVAARTKELAQDDYFSFD
eukprot:gene347-440_t